MIMQLSSLRLGPGQPLGRLPASPSPGAANSGTPHRLPGAANSGTLRRLPGAANSRTRDLCGFVVEVKNGFFRVSGKRAEVPAFAGMTGVLAGMTGTLRRLPGAANSRTRDLRGFIVEVKNGFFRVSGKHAEVPAFAGMTGVLAGMTGSLVGMTEILREQMGNK